MDVECETEAIHKAAQKRIRLSAKAVTSKDRGGDETTGLRLSLAAGCDDDDNDSWHDYHKDS